MGANLDSNTAQSVTCEVQNTGSHTRRTTGYASTDCPEPRCTVYDELEEYDAIAAYLGITEPLTDAALRGLGIAPFGTVMTCRRSYRIRCAIR